MPTDSRRITGPEESFDPSVLLVNREKTKEVYESIYTSAKILTAKKKKMWNVLCSRTVQLSVLFNNVKTLY